MSVAGVSLLVLPAIFIIGTVWPISIGVVSFAATFVVGILIAGIPAEGLFALFPADIFVLLAGITYMFSVARQNGTMAVITEAAVRLVRGRVAVIPWIFHALAIVFSAMGAGPAAATAVLIPVALGVAQQAKISPLLMGIMVIHGSHAGSMSPLSPIGALVNGAAATAKLPDSSGTVFVSSLLFNITLALTAYLLLGGVGLMRRGSESIRIGPARAKEPMEGHGSPSTLGTVLATQESTTVSAPATLRPQHLATLAGIAALVVLGVGFQFNVGLSAFAIGLLLTAMAPKQDTHAVASMSWSTMLMLSGVMTYIGLVTKVGGMRLLSDALLGAGSPVLAVLLIAFVAALTSLFSATGAVVGALVPVLGAVLGAHASVPAAGALSGVAISSSVVDSSPLSLQGAVLLANVEEHQRRPLFRRLMAWGAAMVVVGSAVPLLLFVLLPMWLG
ncbi:SLC13 family permease [Streptomyces sp. NBC_01378]|uniref:SLC13 family permease n=1 Tax=Streptomyces sp. NBC_01378 TaxID=2903844 RepID=UPI003244E87C